MHLTPQEEPDDYDLFRHYVYYKKGRHGHTYRWSPENGWVRSTCTLSKVFGGGWVLKEPRPVPRVVSDFALPASSMTQKHSH